MQVHRQRAVRDTAAQEDKMSTSLIDKVTTERKDLPYELQRRVLEFTRSLAVSSPHGVRGSQLLHFGGAIPEDDLQLMRQAIGEHCER
jgi:hypothetical protein